MGPARGQVALPPSAWTILAHVLGGTIIGAFDCARLGSPTLAFAVVPLFAATGFLAGLVVATFERVMVGRRGVALVVTIPTLLVTAPVAATAFDAWDFPDVAYAPYAAPVAVWLLSACAVAFGRWVLRDGDLTLRASAVLVLAGAIGGVVYVKRHLLEPGDLVAHTGATVALVVLAGVAVRVTRGANIPPLLTALAIGLVGGTTAAALMYGLTAPGDNRLLDTAGDQSRDIVHLWRAVIDLDRDGYSAVLGGGDCDDLDARVRPGAGCR